MELLVVKLITCKCQLPKIIGFRKYIFKLINIYLEIN